MSRRLIIAVRGGPDAKSRLAAILSSEARAALVAAMLEDVVATARAADPDAAIQVLTPTDAIADLARDLGATVVRDATEGLNAAVAFALGEARADLPVVLLHGDLPLIQPSDVAALFAVAEDGAVGLAAAADGGTNAVALPVGAAFAPAFGPGSLARHRAAAESAGLRVRLLKTIGLERDLDRPADIAAILAAGAGRHTAAVLSRLAPAASVLG